MAHASLSTRARRGVAVALLFLAPAAATLLPGRATTLALAAGGAEAQSREYQLKAAFIFNFLQFVEWPDAAFANPQAPLVITVVGENPFGTAIEQATRGKVVRGREIAVRYARNASAAGPSHLLFLAPAGDKAPTQSVRDAAGTGRLTVADVDDFVTAGGCVQFYSEDNKLRFSINTAAVNRAGLKVSAKLLQLARVYREPGGGNGGRAD